MKANTTTFANKRPPNGICADCGCNVQPILRPAVLDLPPRWFAPAGHCEPCARKREERVHVYEEQQRIHQAFRDSRLSPRFRERTLEDFEPTEGTRRAYEIATHYSTDQGGLLFFGPVGTGKTHLAAAIVHTLIGTVGTLFISCPELLMALREAIHEQRKAKRLELLNMARDVEFLVLDDIGAERTSEWVQETLFVLINHRYEFKLPTVFTTNCSIAQLEEKLGKRITSRIVEMCRCIRFAGLDYRLRKRRALMQGQQAAKTNSVNVSNG